MGKRTKCYIEEYKNEQGLLSARLREKGTGRKVDLGITLDGKQDFLRFLSAAGANKGVMPDVFAKDGGEDCVIVSGDLDFDSPDEIRFIYNGKLSYTFA
ncbi:hypothetical protein [Pseudarthrobacter sp. NPDC080039]|uniref:hypothetical protein n=1 Tax=unclassified Pseudarthrobacter TaxID=2647000 RepID=UPI00344D977C